MAYIWEHGTYIKVPAVDGERSGKRKHIVMG